MQLSRCPTCHARINLDSLCQDEAGRELLGILAGLDTLAGSALIGYLGLFRPATRDLSNDRALRLAREAMALGDMPLLIAAMAETVQAMRAKQDEGGFKPLTNHRYLQRVLESISARPSSALAPVQRGEKPALKPASKSAQALDLLTAYPAPEGMPDWFVRTVCGSLAELVSMSLDGMPALDTLPFVVDRWLGELYPKRNWRQKCRFRGAKRLRNAIIDAAESRKRWPTPGDALGNIPRA